MTITCSLGPQLKEEALSIDIKLLLNTEILKTVGNLDQGWHKVLQTENEPKFLCSNPKG